MSSTGVVLPKVSVTSFAARTGERGELTMLQDQMNGLLGEVVGIRANMQHAQEVLAKLNQDLAAKQAELAELGEPKEGEDPGVTERRSTLQAEIRTLHVSIENQEVKLKNLEMDLKKIANRFDELTDKLKEARTAAEQREQRAEAYKSPEDDTGVERGQEDDNRVVIPASLRRQWHELRGQIDGLADDLHLNLYLQDEYGQEQSTLGVKHLPDEIRVVQGDGAHFVLPSDD